MPAPPTASPRRSATAACGGEDRGRQPIHAKMLRVAIAPGAWQDLGLGRKCRSAPRRCRRSRMATSCRPPGRHPASTGAHMAPRRRIPPMSMPPAAPRPAGYDKKVGSSCRAAARSAAIRPGSMRPWRVRIICRTGWPASRSAPSTPRSSPAMRRSTVSNAAAVLGGHHRPGQLPWPARVAGRAGPRWQTKASCAASALLFGQPGFFAPRRAAAWLRGPEPVSYYDTAALEGHAGALVDFDRINAEDDPLQRRRGQCPHRQFRLFRQCKTSPSARST